MSRRRFLVQGSATLAAAALRPLRVGAAPAFDLVLRGGSILDGTGGAAFPADVGIQGDRIAALGTIAAEQGRDVIELRGLTLAPGFIDIHSHSDDSILVHPGAESRVRQGITTEVTGNCGSSAAPLVGQGRAERLAEWQDEGVDAGWTDVASYLARVDSAKVAANQALLLGQGTLRANAIGEVDRPLSADELAAVLRAVEEGMDQGAWGLSTGLEYTPGRYTGPDEIAALAAVVARRGGLYASHVRDEESAALEAVEEALAVGRRTGVRVQVSHVKVSGRPNWGKQEAQLALIESARRSGVDARGDAYPYTAYSTGLASMLEGWALEGGTAPMVRRLKDPADRGRIRKELAARIARDVGDATLIVLSSVRTEGNRGTVGRTLAQVAEGWGVEPAEAALRLLEEEEGSVGYIGHGMSEANVERILAHPLILVSTDGRSLAPTGRAAQTRPHPRSYGTCARVLGHFCRERRIFDLPTAVRKMTSLPADQLGLTDRGRLARGHKADLVAFDPAAVREESTFAEPHRYPSGIPHVLVNGVPVARDGRPTGARPGRALRRT